MPPNSSRSNANEFLIEHNGEHYCCKADIKTIGTTMTAAAFRMLRPNGDSADIASKVGTGTTKQ
jgi:hypothetical protein